MRTLLVVLSLGLVVSGCKSKRTVARDLGAVATKATPATTTLVAVTAATKLDAVRRAFNAHKGEARFLTLLSPT